MKDICNELDVKLLCHKILQNVSTLLHADRASLFLVHGERSSKANSERSPQDRDETAPAAVATTNSDNESPERTNQSYPTSRYLVSKLFDVRPRSTPTEMEKNEEIKIPWGTGIVGYVAESGEPVNIPDAYKVTHFFGITA